MAVVPLYHRWQPGEVDRAEALLEEALAKVRRQKAANLTLRSSAAAALRSSLRPPATSRDLREMLHPAAQRALAHLWAGTAAERPLAEVLQERGTALSPGALNRC